MIGRKWVPVPSRKTSDLLLSPDRNGEPLCEEMMQHLVLNQRPTMKAGLLISQIIPAVTDLRSVINVAVCELHNRGEKVQRWSDGGAGPTGTVGRHAG